LQAPLRGKDKVIIHSPQSLLIMTNLKGIVAYVMPNVNVYFVDLLIFLYDLLAHSC